MTMPCERTRSLVQTGEFLRELSRDQTLPESVRQQAKRLLRHYPEPWVIFGIGSFEELLQTKDPSDPTREFAIVVHTPQLSSSTDG